MSTTRVVNIKHRIPFDVFIGRRRPYGRRGEGLYGNPFSHISHARGVIRVATREEAVDHFARWLAGDKTVAALLPSREESRRQQILASLPSLRGKVLGCYCDPEPCHGHILARLADLATAKGPGDAPRPWTGATAEAIGYPP